MKTLPMRIMAGFALLLALSLSARAESWRGITPLKSTRADVERLLGKPVPGGLDFLAVYKLETGEVHVQYATGRLCRELDKCKCRVPDDTVIEVSVESKVKAKFSTLKIDKTVFDRFPLVENTSIMIYYNSEAGLAYSVSEKGDQILSVQYGPSKKDCETVLQKATKKSL
jgi:hypothetical protein